MITRPAEHEPPEAELGRADGVCQVEDVPGEPHDQRAQEQPSDNEGGSAGEKRAETEDCEHPGEHRVHLRHTSA